MQFSGFTAGVLSGMPSVLISAVFVLWLSACQPATSLPPPTPVSACGAVSQALLGLRLTEDTEVSEQEIRGERIVVHLQLHASGPLSAFQVVCVFAANPYPMTAEPEQPYSLVPTRVAVNQVQVTESQLVEAIIRAKLPYKP